MNLLAVINGVVEEINLDDYSLQKRGGKGSKVSGTALREDIVLFTDYGRMLSPDLSIPLLEGEEIITAEHPNENGFAFLITKKGYAKRVRLGEVKKSKKIISLSEDDLLVNVKLTTGNDELLIVTAEGKGLRVYETEFSARWIKAITLKEDDYVADCEVVTNDSDLFIISENGIGKRTKVDKIPSYHRRGKGVRIMRLTEKTGVVSSCRSVKESDDIVVITNEGRLIRVKATEIPVRGFNTSGVIVIRLENNNDFVTGAMVNHEKQD